MSKESKDPEVEALQARKNYLFKELTRLSDESKHLSDLEADIVLRSCNRLQDEFGKLVNDIFVKNATISDPKGKIHENDFKTFQVMFDHVARSCVKVKTHAVASVKSAPANPDFKLPKLSVPVWNGDIKSWIEFKTQFDSIVHSRQMKESVKLQYLRASLKDEPLSIVSKYPLVDASYDLAYQDLVKRYQNERRLAAYHIQQILNFKSVKMSNKDKLKENVHFLETHRAATAALKNLGINDLSDFLMFELCYQNLPLAMQKGFDREYKSDVIPSLQDLFSHVECYARTEELHTDVVSTVITNPSKKTSESKNSLFVKSNNLSCYFCKEPHKIFRCAGFLALPVSTRIEKIKEFGCCPSCLYKHPGKPCQSIYSCKSCSSKKHNSILHEEPAVQEEPQKTVVCNNMTATSASSEIMLGTIQCYVKDAWGKNVPVRAVLDPGSEITVIESSFFNSLGLRHQPAGCTIFGIANNKSKPLGKVHLSLCGRVTNYQFSVDAIILPKLCNQLPSGDISPNIQSRFKHIQLADPDCFKQGTVQILLGADIYADLLSDQQPVLIKGNPSCIRTHLGYVVFGRLESNKLQSEINYQSLRVTSSCDDSSLTRFWETEEVDYIPEPSIEDQECESHFVDNHYRLPSGRFGVRLPFKKDAPPLGRNKEVVLRSFNRLNKRLQCNEELKKAYSSCLSEYIQMGHMSICLREIDYLLPHREVVRNERTSTKVRVVFNCSFPDHMGISLNERLLKGPTLLEDISSLIMNFRFFKVALTCDLRMMYRFVEVHEDDRRYLVIPWWAENEPNKICLYEMNRLTFGLKPAGFLAGRCVQELANLHKNEYEAAANAIFQNRYCDDFLSGAASEDEARALQNQLTSLLAKGEFEIRKWSSNVPSCLVDVPLDFKEKPMELPGGGVGIKVLGVTWDQSSDCFTAKVEEFQDEVVTKRSILSYIAKIYDINGFYCPVIFTAKSFLQRLWLYKLNWDQEVPDDLSKQWLTYASDLKNVQDISVPRYIPTGNHVRLVGFSDASERGMCAVAYLVTEQNESYLLKAKSKLAPIKVLTIPRLELCAALLLSKLIKGIVEATSVSFESVTLYTDSTIVLGWLKQPLHLLKIFIGNRVSQIHQNLSFDHSWHHVVGLENPADLGSRGMSAADLKKSSLWWHGSSFLSEDFDLWPKSDVIQTVDLPEMKSDVCSLNATMKADENVIESLINKYSSWSKLQRVMSYVLRFIHNCKKTAREKSRGPLKAVEIKNATFVLIRVAQEQDFPNEIKLIKAKKFNDLNKQIKKLSPFFDEECKVLRVGGRLAEAQFLPYETKHPMLLLKTNCLSTIICDHYHKILLHSGPRSTSAAIRRKFWITSLMVLVKSRIHRCVTCTRFNGKPVQPIMSNVPSMRLQQTSCWVNTSLDFGGPFIVKESNIRKSTHHKVYICVFVCLSTRACHLEMVTDLSANAFLAAYQRFCSRRSVPAVLYSDRGTNFTKSRVMLKEWRDFLSKEEDRIMTVASAVGTKWILNAPSFPNANGCAENCIKGSKSLIKRVVGDQILTFEEFATLLCRVEAVLNSRPITFVSADPNDQDLCYLTPGHFIVGREMLFAPEQPERPDGKLMDRWRRVRQISQSFWNSYFKSYLNSFMQRDKWSKSVENIKCGDIVYITSENAAPLSWPIGRIVEVYPNQKDNVVRVVKVRCRGKEYVRPVNRLINIPCNPSS